MLQTAETQRSQQIIYSAGRRYFTGHLYSAIQYSLTLVAEGNIQRPDPDKHIIKYKNINPMTEF